MRCKKCPKPGSPINNLLHRLGRDSSVLILSACAGYSYEGHINLPEKPYILFSVKSLNILDNLWRNVFSKLNVPTYLVYNGSKQFLFEIDLPLNWPNRDTILTQVWGQIESRIKQ